MKWTKHQYHPDHEGTVWEDSTGDYYITREGGEQRNGRWSPDLGGYWLWFDDINIWYDKTLRGIKDFAEDHQYRRETGQPYITEQY